MSCENDLIYYEKNFEPELFKILISMIRLNTTVQNTWPEKALSCIYFL